MRSFISAVAVILGLLLAGAAVPGIWLDRNIVREDGFVALAAPLGKDAGFQEKLADAAVASFDVEQSVPEPLQPAVRQLVDSALGSLAVLPGYAEAWEETLRRSHRLIFAGDAGSGPRPATSLTLDVAPLVGLVSDAIESSVGQTVEAPAQTLIHIGESAQRQLSERLATYAPLSYPLAAVAGVALLLGLLAARRRWTVLVGTGAGLLVLAALWTMGAGLGEEAAMGRASGNEVAEMFKAEFMAAAAASFAEWVRGAVIAAIVLIAAAVVVRLAGGRGRPQSRGRRRASGRG